MKGETVIFASDLKREAREGSAGLKSQLPGAAMTVSALAAGSGGIRRGGLIRPETK